MTSPRLERHEAPGAPPGSESERLETQPRAVRCCGQAWRIEWSLMFLGRWMNATHSSSWRAFISLHFSKEHPYPLLSLTNPVEDINKHNAASSFRYNTEPPSETPNMNVWQIHHVEITRRPSRPLWCVLQRLVKFVACRRSPLQKLQKILWQHECLRSLSCWTFAWHLQHFRTIGH